jgi:cell division protein FtsN
MEQKKIVWILFAVTLFFLVVVGAGFIWFYPGAGETEQQMARTDGPGAVMESQEFDPIEWVRSSDEYPGLKEGEAPSGEEENFVVVYGEESSGETASGEAAAASGEDERSAAARTGSEERSGTAGQSEAAAPEEEQRTEQQPREQSGVTKTVPEKDGGAVAEQEEKRYEGSRKTIRTVEYWIQAGSYTSKTRAERVREELEEKGFASRITVKEVDERRYFRVRIGPYKHKAEAEKFLTWVKEIKDFEKSYVSRVYTEKRVAN